MKKFRVYCTEERSFTVDVEADDVDAAAELVDLGQVQIDRGAVGVKETNHIFDIDQVEAVTE